MEEAYGFICLSIYLDLIFHIDGLTTPNKLWTKIESFFGVQDEIRGHQLENELISFSLSSFKSMEGLFTKFKSLILFLKKCGIEKKEDQLILSILSKLGPKYLVFFCQLSMLLGFLFRIGKCLLWVHSLIHLLKRKRNWFRWDQLKSTKENTILL